MELKNKIPEQVFTALKLLNESNFSAYIVGGAVRDLIMNKEINDWDICTSAKPEETEEVFKNYHIRETGLKHGTVTVIIDDYPLEITTYRIENEYTDKRRPDSVSFTDKIDQDLARRDFTCNAIAFNPSVGLVDPFNGKEDIQNKIIRCVGNPDERFNEDALRILRALRFSSVLNFNIERRTSESIKKNYTLLSYVSKERIFVELSKLICGKNAANILREYSEVFFHIIPEFKPMKGCTQNHERHIFDVWDHSVEVLNNIRNTPELRFAALLHDSGKPQAKTTDGNGIDHFYGHSNISRTIANKVLRDLKAPVKLTTHICNLVQYHDFVASKISEKTYKKYIGELGIDTVYELFEIREADMRGQNLKFINEGISDNEIGLSILKEIEKENKCLKKTDLNISGNDIIKLGINEGPEIGKIIDILFDEVLEETTINEKPVLIERAKELIYGNS